jgi:hypothetical protein
LIQPAEPHRGVGAGVAAVGRVAVLRHHAIVQPRGVAADVRRASSGGRRRARPPRRRRRARAPRAVAAVTRRGGPRLRLRIRARRSRRRHVMRMLRGVQRLERDGVGGGGSARRRPVGITGDAQARQAARRGLDAAVVGRRPRRLRRRGLHAAVVRRRPRRHRASPVACAPGGVCCDACV